VKTKIFILSMMVLACLSKNVFALCLVDDVGCLAPYILPLYGNGVREWAPVEGKVVSAGNTISYRIKFDSASTYILRTYGEGVFGLDIELVEKYGDDGYSSPRLHLDEIRTTFPSSANARKDTNFIDFLTNWGSGTENNAVFVRNAEEIEPDTYYWVHFIFQENIPDRVTIQPNIQITVDTDWMLIFGRTFEFLSESSYWISQSEYYVLESDSYVQFQATSNGSVDVCWENKTTSYLCSESNPTAPAGIEATTDTENGSSAIEPISVVPSFETNPIDTEDSGIPTKNSSVKVREIKISDDDDEMISHSLIKEPSQKYHIHSVLENTGDDDAYDIELQYWISENKTFGDDDDEYLASDWIDQIDAGESHEDRKTQDESGNQLRTPNQEGLFYIFAIVIVHEDNSANISDINDDDEYSKLTVKEYIPPPPPMEIKITDPSSGEKWKTDKNHSVNWGTTNVPKGSHVKIEYYLYEKNKWYVLDDSTPNDGEKNWDMENKPYRDIIKKDTDAKIRITVVEYPEISIEVKFKIDHKK